MANLYSQKHIQNYYNEYANLETQRWDRSSIEQCKLHVHRHHLSKHILNGDKVLELGAGTGIFTEQMAKLTDQLAVTDLSPKQLEINQSRSKQLGYSTSVKEWSIQDICDLSKYKDQSFDKVVCYGGPLSYVFEQKLKALTEIKRVLNPDGIALVSVMNLWGTVNQSLESIILKISAEENENVLTTGNIHPSTYADSDHHCHMFTKAELLTDIQTAGFELLTLSASNCLSAKRAASLDKLKADKSRWNYFLNLEVRACQSSGMEESGSHMIAVIKKPSHP